MINRQIQEAYTARFKQFKITTSFWVIERWWHETGTSIYYWKVWCVCVCACALGYLLTRARLVIKYLKKVWIIWILDGWCFMLTYRFNQNIGAIHSPNGIFSEINFLHSYLNSLSHNLVGDYGVIACWKIPMVSALIFRKLPMVWMLRVFVSILFWCLQLALLMSSRHWWCPFSILPCSHSLHPLHWVALT